jgi:hypothetical protein
MRTQRSGGACHLDRAELAELERVDELVKHALDELDVSVRALNVNRGTAKAHRHPELGLENAKIGASRAGELEQEVGVGDFDVGGYIGLGGAALQSRFDD